MPFIDRLGTEDDEDEIRLNYHTPTEVTGINLVLQGSGGRNSYVMINDGGTAYTRDTVNGKQWSAGFAISPFTGQSSVPATITFTPAILYWHEIAVAGTGMAATGQPGETTSTRPAQRVTLQMPTIPVPVTNPVTEPARWSSFVDLVSYTVPTGKGGLRLITGVLKPESGLASGGGGRYWVEGRLQYTRAAVTTTIDVGSDYIRNFDPGSEEGDLHVHSWLEFNEGDIITLQARARRQANPGNAVSNTVIAQVHFDTNDTELETLLLPTAGPRGLPGEPRELSNTAPGNTPGTASAGVATTASRGDHDHGITPGTGGGTPTPISTATPQASTTAAGAAGSSTSASAGDHRHRMVIPYATAAPGNTPGTPAVGTSSNVARQDHDHGITPGQATAGLDQDAVDTRIRRHTGQADADADFDEDRIPPGELDIVKLNVAQAFTYTTATGLDAGGNTNALAHAFSIDGQAFTMRRLIIENDSAGSDVILDFNNFDDDAYAKLKLGTMVLDGHAYHFADTVDLDGYDKDDVTREIQFTGGRIGAEPTAAVTMQLRIYDYRYASATQPGLLRNSDWSNFNSKVDAEGARDAVGAALVGGAGITVTTDDAKDQITITGYALANTEPASSGTPTAGTAITVSRGDHDHGAEYQLPEKLRVTQGHITLPTWSTVSLGVASTTLTSAPTLTQAAALTYVNSQAVSPRATDRIVVMRYSEDETLDDRRELFVGAADYTSPFAHYPATGWSTITGMSGGFKYAYIEVADLPQGDSYLQRVHDELTLNNVRVDGVTQNAITPAGLAFDTGTRQPGNVVTVNADGTSFRGEVSTGSRTVFNGAGTGISLINSVDSTTLGLQITTFTDPVNINTEPHGFIQGEFTATLNSRSNNNLSFEPVATAGEAVTELTVRGFTSIDELARSPAYTRGDSQNNIRTSGVLIAHAFIYNLTSVRGVIQWRLMHDSSGNVYIMVIYVAESVVTDDSTVDVAFTAFIAINSTGATRGELPSGAIVQFESANPTQTELDELSDGTVVIVRSGDDLGIKVVDVEVTHNQADTGLGGLAFNPATNLSSETADGIYRHRYIARSSFSNRGSAVLPANNSLWSAMPTPLAFFDIVWRGATDGADTEARLRFTSARTYNGEIVYVGQTGQVHFYKQSNNTDWLHTGLTQVQQRILTTEPGEWLEPGQTPTSEEHTLIDLSSGGDGGTTPPPTATRLASTLLLTTTVPSGHSRVNLTEANVTAINRASGGFLYVEVLNTSSQHVGSAFAVWPTGTGAKSLVVMTSALNSWGANFGAPNVGISVSSATAGRVTAGNTPDTLGNSIRTVRFYSV